MDTGFQPVKKAALAALILAAVLTYPFLLFIHALDSETATPAESINYALMDKSGLGITMNAVIPGIQTLAADSENTLAVRVQVNNADGTPVRGAEVRLEAVTDADAASSDTAKTVPSIIDATTAGNTGTSKAATSSSAVSMPASIGSFHPATGITDSNGFFLALYTPPSTTNGVNKVKLASRLIGTDKTDNIRINLIPVPVVLVHGYLASSEIYSGISAYLKTQGFDPLGISYASQKGVIASSKELSDYLDKTRNEMTSNGIQVKRFDLIAHSMGGLVARYYTCSSGYSSKENVRKLIFLSVPQRGSPFASIGLKYYDDQGIRDLLTDSNLYSTILPSMTNGGLNPSIQTGSIMGRYDEVVSSESASLAEWNIKTELFDVGDSNFTMAKLLSGEILQAANHKLILYNKKVYQRVQQMLVTDIPFPSTK